MRKPLIGVKINGQRYDFDECEFKVRADGYIRVFTKKWSVLELLLPFPELLAALQEERDLWR